MKKLFFICLLVLAVPAVAWADAAYTSTVTPKAATIDYISGGGIAVTDAAAGYTQHVDDTGAAVVKHKASAIWEGLAANDVHPAGSAAVSAACRVFTVTFGGTTSAAGDYLLLYDAASVTGTAKLEVSIGVAQETKHLVFPAGMTFSTGVFAYAGTSTSVATITYEN